jgi:hypothetical protein
MTGFPSISEIASHAPRDLRKLRDGLTGDPKIGGLKILSLQNFQSEVSSQFLIYVPNLSFLYITEELVSSKEKKINNVNVPLSSSTK